MDTSKFPYPVSGNAEADWAMYVFIQTAQRMGCPADQVANFLRAKLIMTAKQCELGAAARSCDLDGGPTAILFGGARGGAKAIHTETPIPTPDGWSMMGDLRVGDMVFDDIGKPCRVLGTSAVMYGNECFAVGFSDGTTIYADAEHLWFTTTRDERRALVRRSDGYRSRRRLARVGRGTGAKPWLAERNADRAAVAVLEPPSSGGIRTTREILETLRTENGEINHAVAVAGAIELPDAELVLDPYVLGVWLGDGSRGQLVISSHDDDYEIRDELKRLGHSIKKYKGKYLWGVGSLTARLRSLGVLNRKHIPPAYLRGSASQRTALVQGLMDTDGCALLDGQCQFDNTNKDLIAGMHELLVSLGIRCSITSRTSKLYEKECGPTYRIKFVAPFPVFRLSRKASRQNLRETARSKRRFIVSVTPIPSVPVRCIEVDSPSHLYLAGRSMVPTHNTHGTLAQAGVDDCMRHPGLKVLFLRNVGQSAKQSFEDLLPKTIGRLGQYRAGHGDFLFKNGSWIKLGHFQRESDIDQYIGLEYDLIVKEEANMISPGKHTVLDSCLRSPVGSGWRARQYNTCNPGGPSHTYLKNMFVIPQRNGTERKTRTKYIHATVDDNPFTSLDYRQWLSSLHGWQLRAWRYGDWDFAAGQFFSNFREDVHVPRPGLEAPEVTEWWGSFDYGYTHFTVFHLFCRGADGVIYMMDEYGRQKADIPTNARGIKGLLDKHGLTVDDLDGIYAGADVFHVQHTGRTIEEDYVDQGITFRRAETDRIAGASAIINCLGDPDNVDLSPPRLLINKRCQRFIETIQRLEHDDTVPERPKKVNDINERGEGGDDFYDSGRYGVMGGISGTVVTSGVALFDGWRG